MALHCRPRIPKEGGVYGVWIAGLALTITVLYRYGVGSEEVLAVLGYIIALFMINPTVKYTIADVIACSSIPSILSIPLILGHGLKSAPIIAAASIAALGMVAVPRYRQIIGAGLLLTPSSLILLKASHPVQALLPMVYAAMATAYALDVVVRGSSPSVRYIAYGLSLAVAILALTFQDFIIIAAIMTDILSRIAGISTRAYYNISLKKYGFVETFRVLIVMVIIGFRV